MNCNRMTIRAKGEVCEVFKLVSKQVGGYATDMAAKRFTWTASPIAKPRFAGTYQQCLDFIAAQGAQFMTEHGIPVEC